MNTNTNTNKDTAPAVETLNRMLELGASFAKVHNLPAEDGHTPFVVIPDNCKAENLAAFYPPQRIKQVVKLLEAHSFAEYVNRYKTEDTLIFATVTESAASFQAVLDYHGAAPDLEPQFVAHTAKFDPAATPEFKTWLAANRKPMSQLEFATWLEDNAKLFTDPAGATLLEIVETLFGKQDVQFTSGVRLQSGGNRINFDENVELRGGNSTVAGSVELPKEVTATFPIFVGSAAYVVRARLKYRIESRKLALWYETIALPEILRHGILALVAQIEEQTGITPLIGGLA